MEKKNDMYLAIKEYLLSLIENGALSAGDKMPSEHDLSQKFGVNRNWPRRALRELEVEGYIARSQGRHSVVLPASARRQSLCIGKAPTLAIALPEYQDIFDRTIADGFMDFVSAHELNSMIYNIRLDEEDEAAFLLKSSEVGIAGLAFWPQHDAPSIARSLAVLRRKKFPVVQIDRFVRDTQTDYVVTDNEAMMHQLTLEVIQQGHSRIAFASGNEDVSSVRERLAGFQRALRENNLPVNEKYFKCMQPGDIASVRGAVTDVMGYREPPTAIVCIHDRLACNILQELDRLDYRVPDHVALAAVDDGHCSQTQEFPMFKIRQQGGEMGRLAAELLLDRLYDPERPDLQHRLPPALPESSSVRPAPHGLHAFRHKSVL